jgi:lipopolysaccharide/colanic/teichoic acid biosynthesis glycosyltransferase
VVLIAAAFVARWLHLELRAPEAGTEGIWRYALLGLLFALVAAVMDSPPKTWRTSTAVVSAFGTALVGMGLAATSQLFFPASLPRFVILVMTALSFGWLAVSGSILALVARRRGQLDRVLAVVNRTDADQLRDEARTPRLELPFEVIEAITDESEYPSIVDRCGRGAITDLVLGPRALVSPVVIEQAEVLHRGGMRVRSLEKFYDDRLGKLPLSSLDRFALMGDIETLHGGYAPLKRAIDLVFAALGALVLLVLLPLVLLGNAIANRGPLLFRQQRAGLFGEPFEIIKLRTMTPGAVDVSGWTSNDDPRITGFGKLLRRTHIDELPQVFNILIGELSIVGPRPEQLTYVRQLEQSLPFYSARHLVRPGLTGWAQVRYPYAASEEDAFVKLQYDLHYVRHESFSTDVRIIALTIKHVLMGGGR